METDTLTSRVEPLTDLERKTETGKQREKPFKLYWNKHRHSI